MQPNLPDAVRWKHLRAISVVVSGSKRNGKEHVDQRSHFPTRYLSDKQSAEAARGRWGIEHNLHWQLDVTFGEDRHHLRKEHADANFSVLRRTARSRQKNARKNSVFKSKRLIAAWSDDYLAKVLFND